MWATSSDALWQHGPAALWIALGVYLAARSRLLWSGLAFGAAIMTRPPIALMVAVAGIYLCIVRRSFRPGVLIGTGSVAGLGALLWYNWWVWGEVTLSGGYGTGISENLLEPAPLSFVSNVVGAFVDPERGLLMYSPFLILLIPGLREAWRRVPDWARAAALGAAVYFVFQLKANRFSGGSGFIGYRYPLEPLTAAAVLLAMSYPMWIAGRQTAKRLFWIAVVISLVPTIYWKAVVVPVLG
jgi:alpha-1,2-mannosyltransferase